MKELLIISGKGGTGKTSVTACFAALARKQMLVDCDVDAADLHLVLKPSVQKTNDFYGSKKAQIDADKCMQCGRCEALCRFDAIKQFQVDPRFCEGCGVCYHACPEGAIRMEDHLSGRWFISDTNYGAMVHARLGTAEENSGRLVSTIRKAAREIAEREGYEYTIIDGPPGTGCPVIASLSGVSLAVVVTEPTVAGIHDMERVLEVASHFGVETMVCINKSDLDESKANEIREYCSRLGIPLAGEIPFDEDFLAAAANGVPLVECSKGPAAQAVQSLWERVRERLSK